jgi:hypothetical protein
VDIALIDMSKGSFMLHALMETEWSLVKDRFPEARACAFASRLSTDQTWKPRLPVFVLTRTSYRFGVAFPLIDREWAYSEFFEYRANLGNFDPAKDIDVHVSCNFVKRICWQLISPRRIPTNKPNEIYRVDKKRQGIAGWSEFSQWPSSDGSSPRYD